MTIGGKLSFRGRVQKLDGRPAMPLLVEGGEDPPQLADLIPSGRSDVEIEVGSGKGAFLVAATEARPESFWLGIEAAPSYAELAAQRLEDAGRTREDALLLVDNASLFLRDRCEPGSVARLHVYFPDPWPKRRHSGRRFFRATPPAVMRRVLRDDGVLFVATDNARYAGEIVSILGAAPEFRRDPDLERALSDQPGQAFSPTNFERKYLIEGRIVRRYAFRAQ